MIKVFLKDFHFYHTKIFKKMFLSWLNLDVFKGSGVKSLMWQPIFLWHYRINLGMFFPKMKRDRTMSYENFLQGLSNDLNLFFKLYSTSKEVWVSRFPLYVSHQTETLANIPVGVTSNSSYRREEKSCKHWPLSTKLLSSVTIIILFFRLNQQQLYILTALKIREK